MNVWKFEGPQYSRKTGRYVTRRFWNVMVDGKTFEGFGTRKAAEEYGERYIADQTVTVRVASGADRRPS